MPPAGDLGSPGRPVLLDVQVGKGTYPGVELTKGCTTVGALREHLGLGLLGELGEKGPAQLARMKCYKRLGGQAMAESAPLPVPPAKLVVDGPSAFIKALAPLLQQRSRRVGSAGGNSPQSARLSGSSGFFLGSREQPNTARTTRTARSGAGASPREEGSTVLDGEAAAAVLHFWFEELTPDDWFWQGHTLDDRIRQDFGALHARAAAGELAGWMQRTDTCLALVVILDQFSRNLYRGSMQAYACDGHARVAANTALARGDDQQWPPGPKRSALYLPFMHSEDMADKRRCVALMREGLAPGPRQSLTQAPAAGVAASATVAGGASGATGSKGTGAGAGESAGLPRLQAASAPKGAMAPAAGPGRRASGALGQLSPGAVAPPPGAKAAPGGRRVSSAKEGDEELSESSEDYDDDDGDASSSDFGSDDVAVHATAATQRAGSLRPPGSRHHAGAGREGGDAALGSYSMQVAVELPQLPVLMLNHEHAKRFRTMKLDAQTQQAYLRDKKDVNRMVRYQCLVCGVNHEFRLNKGACDGGGHHRT